MSCQNHRMHNDRYVYQLNKTSHNPLNDDTSLHKQSWGIYDCAVLYYKIFSAMSINVTLEKVVNFPNQSGYLVLIKKGGIFMSAT